MAPVLSEPVGLQEDMFVRSWRDFVASDARRRGRSDLRRYVREIERASIVYVHNVELRISYMSSNSLTSGLFSHYVVHMNSNHRTVQSFRGVEKPKSLALMCTHEFVAVWRLRLQI